MSSNGGHLILMSITGNGDVRITGMQSGAARGRRRWIVDPVDATFMERYLNIQHYLVNIILSTLPFHTQGRFFRITDQLD